MTNQSLVAALLLSLQEIIEIHILGSGAPSIIIGEVGLQLDQKQKQNKTKMKMHLGPWGPYSMWGQSR